MAGKERSFIIRSYAPTFARYWQVEKAIRMSCGEFKPTHKLTIENKQFNTSEESLYMEVTFVDAGGRLPSGGDWLGCKRYFYSYLDWIAYGKPSFGVDEHGDICNFIGLLMRYPPGPNGEPAIVFFHLDALNGDENNGNGYDDGYDDDDDDDDEPWKSGGEW